MRELSGAAAVAANWITIECSRAPLSDIRQTSLIRVKALNRCDFLPCL
jgi:hypothetical protein